MEWFYSQLQIWMGQRTKLKILTCLALYCIHTVSLFIGVWVVQFFIHVVCSSAVFLLTPFDTYYWGINCVSPHFFLLMEIETNFAVLAIWCLALLGFETLQVQIKYQWPFLLHKLFFNLILIIETYIIYWYS